MRVALIQLNGSDDPAANLAQTLPLLRRAADGGAELIATPEVTNCISASRTHQSEVLRHEHDDPALSALREEAARVGRWVLIGSLALKTDDPDGRFANRSFLLAPDGSIAARYDKIHMFDVAVSAEETYRESAGYRPGDRAVLADIGGARLGMTICFDVRFAALYRRLAQAGARILSVPAAFSHVTGPAHWEVLLRARAIETGCFVIAPAQCGAHAASRGRKRRTHGHSLIVSPWGEILAEGRDTPGLVTANLDLSAVDEARARLGTTLTDAPFGGP